MKIHFAQYDAVTDTNHIQRCFSTELINLTTQLA